MINQLLTTVSINNFLVTIDKSVIYYKEINKTNLAVYLLPLAFIPTLAATTLPLSLQTTDPLIL